MSCESGQRDKREENSGGESKTEAGGSIIDDTSCFEQGVCGSGRGNYGLESRVPDEILFEWRALVLETAAGAANFDVILNYASQGEAQWVARLEGWTAMGLL